MTSHIEPLEVGELTNLRWEIAGCPLLSWHNTPSDNKSDEELERIIIRSRKTRRDIVGPRLDIHPPPSVPT